MIPCTECLENARKQGDDPRVPVGRYHQSSCDFYCDKPTYFRELEQEEVKVGEPEWEKSQWEYVRQLRAQVNYLNSKVTELRAKKGDSF